MKMKDYDYLLPIPVLIYLLIKSFTTGAGFFASVFVFLLCAVIWLGFCALVLRWPKRSAEHERNQALLSQPRHTAIGSVLLFSPYDTGKVKYDSVIDGTTREIGGNWSYYVHSHTESRHVYDGFQFTLLFKDLQQAPMQFRVKSPLFEKEIKVPAYYDGIREVVYVTDTDGTNYCLSIRPVDVF